MKGLIQRVSEAAVSIEGETVAGIGSGILLLLGVEAGDAEPQADKLLHRVLNYRIFADDVGKMNRSLLDIGGGLLVVSQFTLAAQTAKGMRPSFSGAAPPQHGQQLYDYFLAQAAEVEAAGSLNALSCGRFGTDMAVSLVNDGPVTFLLQT